MMNVRQGGKLRYDFTSCALKRSEKMNIAC